MSLDPQEEQSERPNEDSYETILGLELSQLTLSLDDKAVEEENEMSKFYMKFVDSAGCTCIQHSIFNSMTCI